MGARLGTGFQAIEPLEPADLARTIFIRGKAHTVVEAINRQLTHYAQHTGQIIFLAKHLRSTEWQTLSIPRNRSAEFNAYCPRRRRRKRRKARRAAALKRRRIS